MSKVIQITVVFGLILLLILVRVFQEVLFYDPLIVFFEKNHSTSALPNLNKLKLVTHVIFRFVINSVVSIGVLWGVFKKRELIKIGSFFYTVLLIVLIIPFVFLIDSTAIGSHLSLFYIRRFLIQPLFLLLLIPAFYFQKKA